MSRVRLACVLMLAMASGCRTAGTERDAPTAPPPPPLNVVVIVSDDHRADVLGCAGHPVAVTPSLDALAARGVRYSNAFVTTSICAASRASILTGLPEHAHGFTFGKPPLSRELVESSYPARLRDAGYRTGFTGKFGVKVEGGRAATEAMFDEFTPIGQPFLRPQPDGSIRHTCDLIGDAAIAFIESTPSDAPFCLSVSFNAAHAVDGDLENHYPPAPPEAELLADVPMPRPRLDDPAILAAMPEFLRDSIHRDRWRWRWDTPEKYDHNLRNYLRLLAGMDRNIGRIVEAIEASGRADDTLVIFLGDNGYYMNERGFAGKWSHFEESLRIPMIVFDPRRDDTDQGFVDDSMVLNIDVAPTALDAAGVAGLDHPHLGSPLPLDADRRERERTGFRCEHHMAHPRIPKWIGYRTDRWKYARYLDHPEDGEFLHDLAADPDELVNLADDPEFTNTIVFLRRQSAIHDDSVSASVFGDAAQD